MIPGVKKHDLGDYEMNIELPKQIQNGIYTLAFVGDNI